jgi:tyrosyl-tRNA synthetase
MDEGGSMALSVLRELDARQLIAQISDREGLDDHLRQGSRTLYCGFDPTADSLHIGNLVPLLTLARFQRAGHRPIALVGGATGLIGDPSFKQNERALNEREVVAHWVECIRHQVSRFLDLDGNNAGLVVNNLDWTRDLDVISFLRDVGKHFSVNAMMQKESVRARLAQENTGISFTEFSYMILQSMDFMELARRYGCTLQVGGSDQWGNITSGLDLVRRTLSREAFALTVPLVTKADGTKFGKTESGSVWLDPAKTSPYSFFQFWLNAADADVERFLKCFTFVEVEEIQELRRLAEIEPQKRAGQRRLAEAVTRLVHGEAAVASSERIGRALFSEELHHLTVDDLEQLRRDGLPVTTIDEAENGLLAFLANAGLAQSRGAARKLIHSRGVSVNGVVIEDDAFAMTRQAALFGRYHLIRRGKKHWHLGVHAGPK